MALQSDTLILVRWFEPALNMVQEEQVVARDAKAARTLMEARISGRGGIVLSAAGVDRSTRSKPPASKNGDIVWWCRELRTLVGAGMTVVEALETLNLQQARRRRGAGDARLIECLRAGKSLSSAMKEVGGFPAVLVAGIHASERTSSIAEAIDEYLRYNDILQRLRKQVVSAAIYPAVVMGLGLVITLTLILFVVPRFAQMYKDLRGNMSWTTMALVSLSRFVEAHYVLVASVLAIVVLALAAVWRTGRLRSIAVSIALRIEPLQRQLDEYRLAKLYQSLSLLFRGGYPLDESLALCADLQLGRLTPAVAAARRTLTCGVGVARAFEAAGLCDDVSERLLSVGERSGNFDQILATIGDRHAGRFSTFVERATRIVEPTLLLLVALTVGALVITMYMPIFDIASSVD